MFDLFFDDNLFAKKLTMTSIHRTSLIEPKQPKNETKTTESPVITRT